MVSCQTVIFKPPCMFGEHHYSTTNAIRSKSNAIYSVFFLAQSTSRMVRDLWKLWKKVLPSVLTVRCDVSLQTGIKIVFSGRFKHGSDRPWQCQLVYIRYPTSSCASKGNKKK